MKKTPNGDYLVQADELKTLTTNILTRVGVPPEDAALVAESLVMADLRGMNSHGVLRLPVYVRRLQAGGFKPDRKGKIVRETQGTVLIDGEHGLGAVLSTRAMDEAIARARKNGIGAAGLLNSNHNGEGAFYALRAVKAGMIGICTTSGSPISPPWGGKTKLTGPLPITVGAPAGKELPIILDAALGMSSRGKILYHAEKNMPVPEGWLVDSEGRPTTDAEQIRKGGWINPIGGYKGWGLVVIMEILAGVLTGAALGGEAGELYTDVTRNQKNGQFFIAIDVAAFMEPDDVRKRMDAYIRTTKDSEKLAGVKEIDMPGEPEFVREKFHRENGIPLGRKVMEEVLSVAGELKVEVPNG
jgi:LDH2 family malate/lactate/ureidoglycolate dehydrogenase